MGKIKFYGASDDLIEIESTSFPDEEFNVDCDDVHILAVSDGTLIRVRYDEDGVWRFTPFVVGSAKIEIDFGQDDDRHSDLVTLSGDELRWVVLGSQIAK